MKSKMDRPSAMPRSCFHTLRAKPKSHISSPLTMVVSNGSLEQSFPISTLDLLESIENQSNMILPRAQELIEPGNRFHKTAFHE